VTGWEMSLAAWVIVNGFKRTTQIPNRCPRPLQVTSTFAVE
jgi:hypothetical protein